MTGSSHPQRGLRCGCGHVIDSHISYGGCSGRVPAVVATAGVVCGCPFTTRQAEFFAVKMTYHPTKRNFVWKFRLDSDVWTEWTWCVSPGRKSSVMETFTTWDDAVRYATVGWLGPYGPVTGAPDVTEEM